MDAGLRQHSIVRDLAHSRTESQRIMPARLCLSCADLQADVVFG